MVKYVKASSQVEVYRGIEIGMQDEPPMDYYCVLDGKVITHPDIDGIRSKIDSYKDRKSR